MIDHDNTTHSAAYRTIQCSLGQSAPGQSALGKWICLSAMLMCLAGCGFQLKGSDAASSSAKLEGMTLQLMSSQPRSELTGGSSSEARHRLRRFGSTAFRKTQGGAARSPRGRCACR